MVDVTDISTVVVASGVLKGVVYYLLEMRHQEKMRKTDLVISLYSTWESNTCTMKCRRESNDNRRHFYQSS